MAMCSMEFTTVEQIPPFKNLLRVSNVSPLTWLASTGRRSLSSSVETQGVESRALTVGTVCTAEPSVEMLTCVFTGCISSSGSERQASPGGISAVQTDCKVREH